MIRAVPRAQLPEMGLSFCVDVWHAGQTGLFHFDRTKPLRSIGNLEPGLQRLLSHEGKLLDRRSTRLPAVPERLWTAFFLRVGSLFVLELGWALDFAWEGSGAVLIVPRTRSSSNRAGLDGIEAIKAGSQSVVDFASASFASIAEVSLTLAVPGSTVRSLADDQLSLERILQKSEFLDFSTRYCAAVHNMDVWNGAASALTEVLAYGYVEGRLLLACFVSYMCNYVSKADISCMARGSGVMP